MLIGIGAVPSTTTEYVTFQQTPKGLPMFPHGHPDPATLINAGVYDQKSNWSAAQLAYIEGGSKPSTFGRDLQGVSNQVPRWIWISAGGVFVALGIMAYRQTVKRK